jgi:hypothetical protein
MPLFADCQKQSAKALKQVAKALPPVNIVVGKGDVHRYKMTVRVPFADCHTTVGKGFF